MKLKSCLKSFILLIPLILVFSKAIAEPTLVRSKAVENEAADFMTMALTFNNDGTKMYTSSMRPGGTGDKVYEYDLTAAYNISTATLRTSINVGTYSGSATGIHGAMQVVFNNDGTKMFIADHHKTIIEWTLTTPYDIDTASTTYNAGQGYNTNPNNKRLTSVAFNNDGTKMFVTGNHKAENPQSIHEYTLDTPFVIESGVTHVQEVQPDDLQSDYVDGIVFNYDGTKMFITSGGDSGGDNKIRQYKLTTAFSIATLSLEGTVELSNYSGLGSGRETAFNSDGSKMFVIDVDAEVYEFDLTCNWSIIDGTCDDPITTTDGSKDILSSIESQTATAKQIAIQASAPVLNRMYWLRRRLRTGALA